MRTLRGEGRRARSASDRSFRTGTGGVMVHGTHGRGFLLVAFMRCLACVWVAQSLVQWTGVLVPGEAVLDRATVEWRIATAFFVVLDPVAAVGLWLATPWGGIIWLFAAVSQIIAALMIPGFFSPLWIGVNGLLVGLYFILVRLATPSPRSKRPRA